jgi:type I restriction enzyme S subunit
MVRLGDVCEVIAGQSPEGKYYTTDSSYTEFHQGCKAFGTKYLLSSNVYTKEISKLASAGSIVMSVRAPVGTVNITRSEICIGRGLCAFKLSQKVDREYLYYYLLSSKKYLDDVAGAGTVFPSISRKQLVEIQIPLPSLEVQREIVERLETELGEIEKLMAEAERGLKAAENLRKAILSEAFE